MQQQNAGSTRARFALRWCPCSRTITHKLQLALCGGGGSGGGGGGGGGLYLYVVVMTVCGGGCVVVVLVHGSNGHPCVAVMVLLYDYVCAWWLWSMMNEDVP